MRNSENFFETNKLRAIIDAWTDSQQLAAEATDATGNAMANQEKYVDSLEGKLQSIDTEFDTFWLHVLDSDLVLGAVSLFETLAKGLNNLSDVIGDTPTAALTGAGTIAGATVAAAFTRSLIESLKNHTVKANLMNALGGFFSNPVAVGIATAAGAAMAAYYVHAAYERWEEERSAKASQDAQSVQEQLSGIDEYIKKIEAAREIVDSNLSTEQERTQAKSELYDIQKQLNEIYGEEAGALDLVNGKLSEQKEIIEGLTTSSLDKWATGTTEVFKLFGITFKEGESNLNYGLRQAEYLTSREGTRFKFQSNLDEESYQKLNDKVNSLGLTLDKMVNLPGRGNDLKDYYAIDTAGLTPEEAQAALQELASYVAQLSGEASEETQAAISSFHDGVSRGIQDIVTAINNATDPARSALLYKLQESANAGDSTGMDLYRDYEKAEADYRKALLGSDDQAILDTAERLRNVYKQIELFLTDTQNAAANLAEYGQKVNEQFGYGTLGNVDNTRKERYTTGQEMINAGWTPERSWDAGFARAEIAPSDKLTLFTQGMQIMDKTGGFAVEFTPIFVAPDGERKVFSPEELADYAYKVEAEASRIASKEGRSEINYNDILEADAQNFGLLVTGNSQRVDAADEAGWEDAWAYVGGVEEGIQENKDRMMDAIEGVIGGKNQGQYAPLFERSGFEDAGNLKRLFEAEARTVDTELYDALKTAKGAGLDIYDLVSDTFDSSELPEHVRQALQTIHDKSDEAKMGTDDLRSSLENVGYAARQISKVDTSNVLNFTDTQGEIDKLQSIVNTVTSTIEKLNDTGLDNAGLSSIFGAFNQSGLSNMSGWMEQLNAARGSAAATKQVLSDMLTTLVSEKNYVTEDAASYQYLQQALQEMGFTMGALSAQQKEFLDQQMASVEATIQQAAEQGNLEEVMRTTVASEISGLQQVAEQLGITSGEWLNYFYTKMSNNSAINVSGDLHNLMLIIGMLDNAQLAWIKYYQARADMLKSASKTATSVSAGTPLTEEQQSSLKGGLMASADVHMSQAVSSIKDFNTELARLQNTEQFTHKTQNIADSFKAVESGAFGSTEAIEKLNSALAQGAADNEALGLQKTEDFLKNFNVAEGNGAASWEPPASTGGKSGGGGGGGDKSQKDESKEFIDWYQRRIDVMEKYHTELQKISSNEQKSYGERRKALQEQIVQDSQVLEVYRAQAKAYENVYQNSVNSLKKLADESGKIQVQKFDENGELEKAEYTIEEITDLVQNGGLDAAQFTGESAKAVQEVISGYDDLLKILQQVSDKEEEMANHRREQLDLEIDRLDAMQSYIAAVGSVIQSEMDYANATGQIISVGMYKGLIDNVDRQMDVLEDKISEYENYLNSGALDPDSAEYYEVLTALTECNNELIQCSIKQAEWNEAIKDIPINLIKKYINEINRIKADVQNFMSEEDSVEIAHNYEEYSKLIELNQENIKKQLEQIGLLRDKLADYEWGSEKYEETAAEIQSVEDEVSNLIQEMNEFHKAILNLPIEKFAEINEQLQSMISAMNDIKSEYDQVIDAVVEEIEKHGDLLKEQQEEMEDDYDKRIQAIQDEIDALDKANEARQKQIDMEQAEAALRKANSQKTVAVIRDGTMAYVQDQEALRKAQEDLDNAAHQLRIYELQKQIEDLEEERDKLTKNYEDQIDNLDKISNKWSEIVSNIEHAKDALIATNVLGNGWVAKVTSGDDEDIYQMFKKMYESLDKDITTYQDQVDSNERISALMSQYVDAYLAGNLTYDQATAAMRGLVNELNSPDGLTATENMKSLQSFFGDLFSTNGSVAEILKSMNSAAQQEAGNYDTYFKVVRDNINLMDEYTTTWDELKKSVDEQIEALKAAYEAAKEAAMRMKEYASRYHDGGGDSGGGNIYVQGDYVVAGADRVYYDPDGHTGSFTHGEGVYSAGQMVHSYHEGIENGLVGSASSDKRYQMLQEMSLKKLKPNEIPALLKTGEAVLNGQQQTTLLGNIRQLAKQQMIPQISGNQGVQVNLTMSNLTFHEINNGQDFANYITNNLSSAIAQGLARG